MFYKKTYKLLAISILILLFIISIVSANNKGTSPSSSRYKNSSIDYSIEIPNNIVVDTNYLPYYLHLYNNEIDIKISKELSYYEYDYYFTNYIYKYMFNTHFTYINEITILENCYKSLAGNNTKVVSMYISGLKNAEKQMPYYYHALMTTGNYNFYMFNIKTTDSEKYKVIINNLLNSFQQQKKTRNSKINLLLKPTIPKNWNKETLDYYNNLSNSKDIKWGIFVPTDDETWNKVNSIEEKIDYNFEIFLKYLWVGEAFPIDILESAYKDKKIVELTLQSMWDKKPENPSARNANDSVLFDILRGDYDDNLKEYAKQLKQFGHPVLLRLNNEANSTWTLYSGIATMCDSDLYISCWRYIYNLFKSEGVDNVIWIYCPHDRSYPPMNWNNQIAYYPGNDYVQIIGITGYNNGTYYKSKNGEHWRSFDEIYGKINKNYYPLYKNFPWIIGEFASSSVGGNKAQWITNMFVNIPKYKNIKAAVWWSYYDTDPETKEPARKYWLDESLETLKAFKEGVHK